MNTADIGYAMKLERERGKAMAELAALRKCDDIRHQRDQLREAIYEIHRLAGWHTDDAADPTNPSPHDAVAHTNGLIRQLCIRVSHTKP